MLNLKSIRILLVVVSAAAILTLSSAAFAAPPVVKTVPSVAANPLIPHDSWSGKLISLKGTTDVQGSPWVFQWDFGDGTASTETTVTDKYNLTATHTYTGAVGTVFTARLKVRNTSTAESGENVYFVAIQNKSLEVEVNVAIDEGLWAIHRAMTRWDSGGIQYGDWRNWSGFYGLQGANVEAFFAMGHRETGSDDNPYSETVRRAMSQFFADLYVMGIGAQSLGNPDTNGNGLGITTNQGYYGYQTGMMLSALVASDNPNRIAATGPANVVGRKYKDIAQDIMDWIAWAQYDDIRFGGWRYSYNEWPDNSACQWNAVALIAAERLWGLPVPQWVKDANKGWLNYSHNAAGYYGYTDVNPVWGPLAVTASGMVQAVMDGLGRGNPRWDLAETYLRNQWDSNPGYGPMKTNYYYALFSFTKSMLLHNPPLDTLHSASAGVPDLKWYSAELSKGDPSDGVARTLVNNQNAVGDGRWWNGAGCCSQPTGEHYAFGTAWAIMMLNQTVIQGGKPVAVAQATPNPAIAFEVITLNGGASFHQDAAKLINKWEWDLNNDGIFEVTGVTTTVSFPVVGAYPVKLRVTDNGAPAMTAEAILLINVSDPPLAPTANAGGPYNFCVGRSWFLDGSASVNPDDGKHQPGAFPGDFIKEYAWELNGDNTFNDAFGVNPNVTGYWTPGSYLIQLRVTDNTALSFPASGQPNLTSTATAQVRVRASTDPACVCVNDLIARAKPAKADLVWTWKQGADHYAVYRGTAAGGPYLKIGEVKTQGLAGKGVFADSGLTNGVTYYYVVREAAANNDELCQSNQASAKPVAR